MRNNSKLFITILQKRTCFDYVEKPVLQRQEQYNESLGNSRVKCEGKNIANGIGCVSPSITDWHTFDSTL